LLSLQHPYSCA